MRNGYEVYLLCRLRQMRNRCEETGEGGCDCWPSACDRGRDNGSETHAGD